MNQRSGRYKNSGDDKRIATSLNELALRGRRARMTLFRVLLSATEGNVISYRAKTTLLVAVAIVVWTRSRFNKASYDVPPTYGSGAVATR